MELERFIWRVPAELSKGIRQDAEIRKILSPVLSLVKLPHNFRQTASFSSQKSGENLKLSYKDIFGEDEKLTDWGETSKKLQEDLARNAHIVKIQGVSNQGSDFVFPNPESQKLLSRVGVLPQIMSRKAFVAVSDDLRKKLIGFKNIKKVASCPPFPFSKPSTPKRRRSLTDSGDPETDPSTPKRSRTKVAPKRILQATPIPSPLLASFKVDGSTSLPSSPSDFKTCVVQLNRLHQNIIDKYIGRV